MLGKRHRKTLRNISVFVLLTDTRIRKMLAVGEVTVSYPFTAVYGPSLLTWVVEYHQLADFQIVIDLQVFFKCFEL